MINFQDKISLSAQRWAFCVFDEFLTSTNFESKRYVYPVCPLLWGHPSTTGGAEIKSPAKMVDERCGKKWDGKVEEKREDRGIFILVRPQMDAVKDAPQQIDQRLELGRITRKGVVGSGSKILARVRHHYTG